MKFPNDIAYIFKVGWLSLFLIPFFCMLFLAPQILLDFEGILRAYRIIFALIGFPFIIFWILLFIIMPNIDQLHRSIRHKKKLLNTIIIAAITLLQFIDSSSAEHFFNNNFQVSLVSIFTISLVIWIVKLKPNEQEQKLEDIDHLID